MQLEDEILRAVRHQAALETNNKKSNDDILAIANSVIDSVSKCTYDFTKADTIILNQNGKRRFAKMFSDDFSVENILCQSIKQIIDRNHKVKYPNRNKSVRALFDVLRSVKQMSDFTIIKFDFKDYFNSVSAEYVFEKYLKSNLSERVSSELIKNYTNETRYAYAGLSTSNVISEIIAKHFDDVVKQKLLDRGVIFNERYIDDSVIIFNEHISEQQFRTIMNEALTEIFYDRQIIVTIKCRTKFNDSKFRYISRRTLSNNPMCVDYLGYEFAFSLINDKCKIIYGITQEKRDKNKARIDEIIKAYADTSSPEYNNLELLRHRISAFCSRTVYRSKKYRNIIWKSKGFISNYGELRFLLGSDLIDPNTENFLKNMVEDGFARANVPLPFFIKGAKDKAGYDLFNNMKANKTLLLVEKIGYDIDSLENLCRQIGISPINASGIHRGYGNLVRDYLIKVRVGY